MKKWLKFFTLTLFLFAAFILTATTRAQAAQFAEDSSRVEPTPIAAADMLSEQAAAHGTDSIESALPDEARAILGDMSVIDADIGAGGLAAIFSTLQERFFGIFTASLRSGAKILTIILLCSLAYAAMDEGGVRDMVSLSGTVAVSAIAIGDVRAFLGLGMETLRMLSDFSRALLPTMATAAASAGAFTSASTKYAATALFMDILLTIGMNVILPLISIYLASVIAGAALGKDSLASISKLLKWVCTTSMTLLVLAFTTYIGLTGLITRQADGFTVKAARTVIGAALPVVGDIISNTAGMIIAGAGLLRNAIGVFGTLAIVAICLIPFLTLGSHYLVYKGTAALSEALTDKRMAELISGIGSAFGMILALVGSGGIMLFISILSSMRAVGVA